MRKKPVPSVDKLTIPANTNLHYFWCGFYIVKGDALELGPFQGDVACYTIKKGRGVCGKA